MGTGQVRTRGNQRESRRRRGPRKVPVHALEASSPCRRHSGPFPRSPVNVSGWVMRGFHSHTHSLASPGEVRQSLNLDPFLRAENQGLGQPGSALKAAVPRPFLRTATDSLVALLCRSSEGRDCADLLLCIVHPQSQRRPAAEEGLLSERTAPRSRGNHGTEQFQISEPEERMEPAE